MEVQSPALNFPTTFCCNCGSTDCAHEIQDTQVSRFIRLGGDETTFHLPVHVGDRLSVEEELVSVSDLKSTRLGDGHFVETLSVFRNQDGEVVAEVRNTLFRFTPRDVGA